MGKKLKCQWGEIKKKKEKEKKKAGEMKQMFRSFQTYTRGKSRKNFDLYEATNHSNPYPTIQSLEQAP